VEKEKEKERVERAREAKEDVLLTVVVVTADLHHMQTQTERHATTVVSLDTLQEIVRVLLSAMLAVAPTMWCVTAQTRRRHAVSVAKWVT
jgi:hypothetical protein